MTAAISISGLGKQYRLGEKPQGMRHVLDDVMHRPWKLLLHAEQPKFWALRGISLDIEQGETLGVIGANGSGKSTLLKILANLTEPTEGKAVLHGRLSAMLEVSAGFHSELTGRENIYLKGAILGRKRAETRQMLDGIVNFAELEQFIDTPIKHYSSGMELRLGFAIAAFMQSEILLLDEIFSVGDEDFRQKCASHMRSLVSDGRTVIFVSHDLAAVRNLTKKTLWLNKGQVIDVGPSEEVVNRYAAIHGLGEIEGVPI